MSKKNLKLEGTYSREYFLWRFAPYLKQAWIFDSDWNREFNDLDDFFKYYGTSYATETTIYPISLYQYKTNNNLIITKFPLFLWFYKISLISPIFQDFPNFPDFSRFPPAFLEFPRFP